MWFFLLVLYEQYFGLSEDQVPVIAIQTSDSQKYLKPNVEADQIAPWLKDYTVYSCFLVTCYTNYCIGGICHLHDVIMIYVSLIGMSLSIIYTNFLGRKTEAIYKVGACP